jgi:hypothetical protein
VDRPATVAGTVLLLADFLHAPRIADRVEQMEGRG